MDSHFTVNLLFFRFYIVFSLGQDRRNSVAPVGHERRTPSTIMKLLLSLVTFSWFALAGLMFAAVTLYLIKNGLDINVFDDISPLSDSLHALNICHE